jgi:hypothetical protein
LFYLRRSLPLKALHLILSRLKSTSVFELGSVATLTASLIMSISLTSPRSSPSSSPILRYAVQERAIPTTLSLFDTSTYRLLERYLTTTALDAPNGKSNYTYLLQWESRISSIPNKVWFALKHDSHKILHAESLA